MLFCASTHIYSCLQRNPLLIRSPKGQERVFLLVRCPAKSAWKSVFRVGKGLISGVSCFTGFCVVGVERERGGGKREGETGESGGKGERHRDIDTETLLCEVGGRAIG